MFDLALGQMLTEVAEATGETKLKEFLFLYVGRKLKPFSQCKLTDSVKCVREL
jgi:hypothetical protein